MGLLGKRRYYSARTGIAGWALPGLCIDQHEIITLKMQYQPAAALPGHTARGWPSLQGHLHTGIPPHPFAELIPMDPSEKPPSPDPVGRVLLDVTNREFIFLQK